jgi:hypothetical protein
MGVDFFGKCFYAKFNILDIFIKFKETKKKVIFEKKITFVCSVCEENCWVHAMFFRFDFSMYV